MLPRPGKIVVKGVNMKIGIICNEYPPMMCGGIGVFTKELAEGLVKAGHQVTVIGVYVDIENEKNEKINDVDVIRMQAKLGRFSPYLNSRALFKKVLELVSKERIDLVEVPDFEGNSAFWGTLPIPVVVRLHGTLSYFSYELGTKKNKVLFWLERKALKRADQILAVTQYVADQSAQLFNLQLPRVVVHNGVKLPDQEDVKKDYNYQGVVAFTGSLMRKKGVLSLAKAWNAVQKRFPDARLVLVGKDTTENGKSVKEMMLELTSDKAHLEFTGHVTKAELQQILATADVAAFPSYSESFGLAPFEAMALGVPTIYTKLSCGPELVRDQIDAILVDPNITKQIEQALMDMLGDQHTRERFGLAGQNRAEEFSVVNQLDRNISEYQALLKKGNDVECQ